MLRALIGASLIVAAFAVVAVAAAGRHQSVPLPTVEGPRITTSTTPTFRFSWRVRGVRASAVRFRCGVDTPRLRPCPRTFRIIVNPGNHVLRVRASAGARRSGVRVVRFVVRRPGPPGPRVTATARVGGLPFGVALGLDGVFVTDFATGRLFRLDASTARTRWAIEIGDGLGGVAVADGAVWTTSFDRNELVRVSADGTPGLRVAVGPGPNAVIAGLGSLWVSNKGCNDAAAACPGPGSVTRVDPTTGRVQATIAVGREPRYLAVDDTAVWVTTFRDNTLARIDPGTNAVTNRVAAPAGPNGVARTGGSVWVAGYSGSVLREYDAATLERRREVRLGAGSGPEAIAVDGGVIWVVDSTGDSVTRVELASGRLLSTTAVGREPRSVAVVDGVAWVTNLREGTVSRVSAR